MISNSDLHKVLDRFYRDYKNEVTLLEDAIYNDKPKRIILQCLTEVKKSVADIADIAECIIDERD